MKHKIKYIFILALVLSTNALGNTNNNERYLTNTNVNRYSSNINSNGISTNSSIGSEPNSNSNENKDETVNFGNVIGELGNGLNHGLNFIKDFRNELNEGLKTGLETTKNYIVDGINKFFGVNKPINESKEELVDEPNKPDPKHHNDYGYIDENGEKVYMGMSSEEAKQAKEQYKEKLRRERPNITDKEVDEKADRVYGTDKNIANIKKLDDSDKTEKEKKAERDKEKKEEVKIFNLPVDNATNIIGRKGKFIGKKVIIKKEDGLELRTSTNNSGLSHLYYNINGITPFKQNEINKFLIKEAKNSLKERDKILQNVVNKQKDPKSFEFNGEATGRLDYKADLLRKQKYYDTEYYTVREERTRKVCNDGICTNEKYYETVTKSRRVLKTKIISPITDKKYGEWVGRVDWSGASDAVLISEKLEKYYSNKTDEYKEIVKRIKQTQDDLFQNFRLENGRTRTGENKDNLDKKGRNANKLYVRTDEATKELFKNYSHDGDDFYDTEKDNARYDKMQSIVDNLKQYIVDEQNAFNDLVESTKQQVMLREILQYNGILNTPENQKENNVYANTFEDPKVKSVENSINYLLSFRAKEMEKLNRALNNGDRRVTAVMKAVDAVEDMLIDDNLRDINGKIQSPQLKRIYQAINVILNQSQQTFNLIAQNQLGNARYRQMQKLILMNQNADLKIKLNNIRNSNLKVNELNDYFEASLEYHENRINYDPNKLGSKY